MSTQAKPNGEVAKQVLRRLALCRRSTVDGKPVPGRGANPKGIIYYDPQRRTWPCRSRPTRSAARPARTPTPDEAQAALAGYIAYFGTYSIDERPRTVTHHRQGSVQPGDTADLVRGYEFAGDRLILRPPGTTHEVVWERIK